MRKKKFISIQVASINVYLEKYMYQTDLKLLYAVEKLLNVGFENVVIENFFICQIAFSVGGNQKYILEYTTGIYGEYLKMMKNSKHRNIRV